MNYFVATLEALLKACQKQGIGCGFSGVWKTISFGLSTSTAKADRAQIW